MYKYVITESSSGYEVYVNLITSSAGRYISRQPHVINLIKEVLDTKTLSGPRIALEHDMGRVIGNTNIVETTDKDTIYYAKAIKMSAFSRYAKNRNPGPSKVLTVILERDADGGYEVHDTWIGPYSPPFPDTENMVAKNIAYWETHAFAQDEHSIQAKTITKICPYVVEI
ncbi:MAG: hypothetical protein WCJ60_01945 [bacterium]